MTGAELANESCARRAARERSSCSESRSFDVEIRSDRGARWSTGVRFELRRGEVLGIIGLQGSGVRAPARAVRCAAERRGGVSAWTSDQFIHSRPARAMRPRDDVARRRPATSVFSELGVSANMTLCSLTRCSSLFVYSRSRAGTLRSAHEMARRLSLGDAIVDAPCAKLSGGNQQKVALGRCLSTARAALARRSDAGHRRRAQRPKSIVDRRARARAASGSCSSRPKWRSSTAVRSDPGAVPRADRSRCSSAAITRVNAPAHAAMGGGRVAS